MRQTTGLTISFAYDCKFSHSFNVDTVRVYTVLSQGNTRCTAWKKGKMSSET